MGSSSSARLLIFAGIGCAAPDNQTTRQPDNQENQENMSEPAEGIWKCKVLSGEAAANDKDIMCIRVNVQIEEGPDNGRSVSYEDQINNKSAKYIAQSAKAVGWRGGRMESTFRSDVEAWINATGGMSTVEIRHLEIKNGKNAGKIWGKANSIGRGPKPLKEPSRESSDDADQAMRAALAEDSGGSGPSAGGGYDDAPPPSDDDIPFSTCSMATDLAPRIAKVLRW